jgi:hypothetical protein
MYSTLAPLCAGLAICASAPLDAYNNIAADLKTSDVAPGRMRSS